MNYFTKSFLCLEMLGSSNKIYNTNTFTLCIDAGGHSSISFLGMIPCLCLEIIDLCKHG